MGTEAAVQHGGLAGGTPGSAQIDRPGRAVRDEIAVPEDKAQPVRRAGRRRDEAAGDVVVHGAQSALLEQGVCPAEDEVDVARDLTVLVILRGGPPGRKGARAEETVLLPLLFGQRGAEQGVLIAQQLHPAEHGPRTVHIGCDGLPHQTARPGIVGDGQVLHGEDLPAEEGRVAAEGVGGPPVRVGQFAAVGPDEDGLVGTGTPQGDAAFFADQLFPVDAGPDDDLGFQFIRYGQHSLGHRSVIAASVLRNGKVQHRKGPPTKEIALL